MDTGSKFHIFSTDAARDILARLMNQPENLSKKCTYTFVQMFVF